MMHRALGDTASVRLAGLLRLVITLAGLVLCRPALAGSEPLGGPAAPGAPVLTGSVLAFGLVFGLKHAVEADHLAAVTTIVSERKSLWSSSLVGGIWGIGHTLSLLVAGAVVLGLRVEIGKTTAMALEAGVGVMLIGLGVSALVRIRRAGTLHVHAPAQARLGLRPLLVGMAHGLAGSSALMLVVLATVPTALAGMIYLGLFGLGSVVGMMAMSLLVSLPFHLVRDRFERVHFFIRAFAGVFSVGFGAFMVYEIGFVDGLFR